MSHLHPERKSYDKTVRPDYGTEALQVQLSAYVRDIGPIKMEDDVSALLLPFKQDKYQHKIVASFLGAQR